MITDIRIPIKISHQGEVDIWRAFLIVKYKHIVALSVEMYSKYCQIDYTGGDSNGNVCIGIAKTKRSIDLKKVRSKNKVTEIEFSEYKDDEWRIFSVDTSKHTVNVVLIKK